MGTIRSVMENVKALDLKKEAMLTVVDMKSDIIDLNREQMQSGVNKEGYDIVPEYAPSTRQRKLRLGRSGKVDLLDKGDFQDAMRLDVAGSDSYKIYSTDWKNAMLVKRYSSTASIFGLNSESRTVLIAEGFEDQLLQRVHDVTKL